MGVRLTNSIGMALGVVTASALLAVPAALGAPSAPSSGPAQSPGGELRFRITHTPQVLNLGTKVEYRLEIDGDKDDHVLRITAAGTPGALGPGVAVVGGGSSLTTRACPSRFRREHAVSDADFQSLVTVPAHGKTFLTAVRSMVAPPWPGEGIGGQFTVTEDGSPWTPATPLQLADDGPKLQVPLGVQFDWDPVTAAVRSSKALVPVVSRRAPLVVSGVAAPLPKGEHVQLDWLQPPSTRLHKLADVKVGAGGRFAYRVRLPRAGRYEFVARHRGGGRFGDDASRCGLVVVAR
jgi:hypothetical protein